MTTAPPTQPATHAAAPARARIAILSEHRPRETRSFTDLLRIEGRKLVNTRAAKILLLAGLLVTIAIVVLNVGIATWAQKNVEGMDTPIDVTGMTTVTGSMLSLFVVLLGVLSITGEWTQRTTLTTFALEPRRGRVLLAKVLVMAAVTTLLVAFVVPVAFASVAVAKAVGAHVVWTLSWKILLGFWLLAMLTMLMGLAFGLATLNTPAAVVAYLLLPMLLGVATSLAGLWRPLAKVMPWVDPNNAGAPLVSPGMTGPMTGTDWWQLLVANLIWVAIPFGIGTWRWLHREVK